MTDERELQEQVTAPPVQYAHLMEHEDAGPLLAGFPGWFKGAAAFLEVHVTYWVHLQGVLLVAVIVQPNGQVRPWLRHWTSHDAALRSAENLVGQAVNYLQEMTNGHAMRDTEDLDYDDFLFHLETRLNGEFH